MPIHVIFPLRVRLRGGSPCNKSWIFLWEGGFTLSLGVVCSLCLCHVDCANFEYSYECIREFLSYFLHGLVVWWYLYVVLQQCAFVLACTCNIYDKEYTKKFREVFQRIRKAVMLALCLSLGCIRHVICEPMFPSKGSLFTRL